MWHSTRAAAAEASRHDGRQNVDDRMKIVTAGIGGAALGALAGYLLLTERGQRLREQIVPQLEEFMVRVKELQASIEHARHVAAESWHALQQLTTDPPPGRTH
jgi:hypothetical protein